MASTNVSNIEIYKASDGFRWRAKAANGEIVASGEAYTTITHARDAAWDVFPDTSIKRSYVGEESDDGGS